MSANKIRACVTVWENRHGPDHRSVRRSAILFSQSLRLLNQLRNLPVLFPSVPARASRKHFLPLKTRRTCACSQTASDLLSPPLAASQARCFQKSSGSIHLRASSAQADKATQNTCGFQVSRQDRRARKVQSRTHL